MKDCREEWFDAEKKVAVTIVDVTGAAQELARGHLAGPTGAYYLTKALAAVALLGGAMVDSVITNSGLVASMWPKSAGLIRIGAATMERCRIVNNSTWEIDNGTGVIVLESSKSVMRDCVVCGNYTRHENVNASRNGFISMNAGLMERCAVVRNTSSTKGRSGWTGGVDLKGGKMTNCLVADNTIGKINITTTTTRIGMGAAIDGMSKAINSLFCNTPYAGETTVNVVGVKRLGSATVVNCAILANGSSDGSLIKDLVGDASFDHCAADDVTDCTDSIPATYGACYRRDRKTGLLKHMPGSPLIDKGKSQPDLEAGVDLVLRPRLHGKAIDIGPFECPGIPGFGIILR